MIRIKVSYMGKVFDVVLTFVAGKPVIAVRVEGSSVGVVGEVGGKMHVIRETTNAQ